jgi:acetyl esterase/lipase/Ca2+-binding EF-hand superfamily protein
MVGAVPVAEVLQRLGARQEAGADAGEIGAYSSHFDRVDLNRDGKHSKEEYVDKGTYMTPQARAGIFRAADGNGDGVVTRDEYVLNRIITDEAKSIVQGMDDDGDGLTELAEFVHHASKRLSDPGLARQVWAALDVNADGGIPVPEYLRVWGQWARTGQAPAEERLAAREAELTEPVIGPHGEPTIWNLWPGKAPGEIKALPPEVDKTTPTDTPVAGRRIIKLTNVSTPQLAIYKPDPAIDTGTAVIIAPGGGHWILAYDLEGTEVATWLNSIGVTGIVLKYRVPGRDRNPDRPWLASVQDGQRAVSLVRGRAKDIGIDPDKIGIMGFSAGGSPVRHTALVKDRLYDPVDKFDTVSFRPDFAAPIYSGGIPEGAQISQDCPPFFMVIAHDDKDRSIAVAELYLALKKANVSAELHIYESGGHGYGLRRTDLPVTSWPDRMEDWMRRLKLLER